MYLKAGLQLDLLNEYEKLFFKLFPPENGHAILNCDQRTDTPRSPYFITGFNGSTFRPGEFHSVGVP